MKEQMNSYLTYEDIRKLPFDIGRHKSVRYLSLEVMIAKDGTIYYAEPSHQEFLIAKAMVQNKMTREELMDACPPEYYANFMDWLIPMSGGYIPVWEIGVLDVSITKEQASALRRLKMAGLYRGAIPKRRLSS